MENDPEEVDWPSVPIVDDSDDINNRAESYHIRHRDNITTKPAPPPPPPRALQSSYNQHPTMMSQNLRLSSSSKMR